MIEAADSGEVQPRISMGPDVGFAALDNRALIAPRGTERTFDVIRSRDGYRYIASGLIPVGADRRTESAAVIDPDQFAALALRRELLAEGIVVLGNIRSTVDSTDFAVARATPPPQQQFTFLESHELIRDLKSYENLVPVCFDQNTATETESQNA